MYEKQADIRDKLKPVERRLKVLNEHIRQVDIYLQHKAVYAQYQQQKPKSQVAFAEKHRAEITLYESASRYLKEVMNGKTTLPVKAWRAEHVKLTAEKKILNQDYALMKDEVRKVESVRRAAYGIMRAEAMGTPHRRSHDINL